MYNDKMDTQTGSIAGELDELVADLARWVRRRGVLSPTAAAVLVHLARHGPARASALAAQVRVTPPSMTTLVARLAAQGLVSRGMDPSDGRAVTVCVTPEGERLLAARRTERTAALAALLAELPDGDAGAIAAAMPALTRLTDAMRRSGFDSEDSR